MARKVIACAWWSSLTRCIAPKQLIWHGQKSGASARRTPPGPRPQLSMTTTPAILGRDACGDELVLTATPAPLPTTRTPATPASARPSAVAFGRARHMCAQRALSTAASAHLPCVWVFWRARTSDATHLGRQVLRQRDARQRRARPGAGHGEQSAVRHVQVSAAGRHPPAHAAGQPLQRLRDLAHRPRRVGAGTAAHVVGAAVVPGRGTHHQQPAVLAQQRLRRRRVRRTWPRTAGATSGRLMHP